MELCGDCGKRLHWIEIAFGRVFDPVCGACLIKRRRQVDIATPITGHLDAHNFIAQMTEATRRIDQ